MPLNLEPNIPDPDGFYEELVACQRDLPDDKSLLFQAKLLLVLSNHVGERSVLTQAMQAALRSL
ncbi:MAG: DUF2783 domain-containing protein [Lacisediminimonas sp.]|nr:DUF2783 domain-containing protein [Lacisediminimonas sp.]